MENRRITQLANSMQKSTSWEANSHSKPPRFTRSLITVFIWSRHWSLSWTRCIQSTTSNLISLRSILISTHQRLGLPSGLFASGFQTYHTVITKFY